MAFQHVEVIERETGAYFEGELVVTTLTHWHIAVDGKVHVFDRQEYMIVVQEPKVPDFSDLFDRLFGS